MMMGLVGVLAMAVLALAKPDTTPKLFSLTGDDTSKLKACQGNQHEVLQCDRINFNLEIFNSDKIALPGGLILFRDIKEEDALDVSSIKTEFGAESVVFKASDAEATLTKRGDDVFGYVEYPNNDLFIVENCGPSCHVWRKENTKVFKLDNDPIEEAKNMGATELFEVVVKEQDTDEERFGTRKYTKHEIANYGYDPTKHTDKSKDCRCEGQCLCSSCKPTVPKPCSDQGTWEYVLEGRPYWKAGCSNPDNDPKGKWCPAETGNSKNRWGEMSIDADHPGEKHYCGCVEWPLRPFRPNREVRDAMLAKGKVDTTTIATISLMFYYTCDFAESTEDVEAYVDELIAITNEGFINSKIPVRVKVHCIELMDISEKVQDQFSCPDNNLYYFLQAYKPKYHSLPNTADSMVFLINDIGSSLNDQLGSCGLGSDVEFLGPESAWSKQEFKALKSTVGISSIMLSKSCAIGPSYTLAHELGHNFGANHQFGRRCPTLAEDKLYTYGFGSTLGDSPEEQWKRNNGRPDGVHTIMAYTGTWFPKGVNYFSNPNVTIKYMGKDIPTGKENAKVPYKAIEDAKESFKKTHRLDYSAFKPSEQQTSTNNAKVIMENRFLFEAVGDESSICKTAPLKKDKNGMKIQSKLSNEGKQCGALPVVGGDSCLKPNVLYEAESGIQLPFNPESLKYGFSTPTGKACQIACAFHPGPCKYFAWKKLPSQKFGRCWMYEKVTNWNAKIPAYYEKVVSGSITC